MLFLSFTAEQDKPLTESLYSVYDSRSFIQCGAKRTTKFMLPMALYYEVAPLLWLRYNAFYISSEEKTVRRKLSNSTAAVEAANVTMLPS